MLLGRSNFDILTKETITSVVKMMENEAKSSKPFKQRKSFGKLCNRFATCKPWLLFTFVACETCCLLIEIVSYSQSER